MSLTTNIFSSSKRILLSNLSKIVVTPHLQKVGLGQGVEEHIRASLNNDADADTIIKACYFYANVSNYRLENREQCATRDHDHIPETLLQFARQSFQACDCRVAAELAWGGANMCVTDHAKKYKIIEMFKHGHKSEFVSHFFSPTLLYGYWKSAEELHRGYYNGFPLEFLDEGFEESLGRIEKFIREVPQIKLPEKFVGQFIAKQEKWAENKKKSEESKLKKQMKPLTPEKINEKNSKAEREEWAVEEYAKLTMN